MKNWLRSYPLGGYIALAYAGSWILWLPALLGRKNLGLLPYELPAAASVVLNQLALFAGPFLASLVMARLTTGSLKIWTASLLRWRVPLVAYLLALVAIPAAVIAVPVILPGETAGGPELSGPALVIVSLVMGVAYLIGGPLQEEVGWRGFALPRLQERTLPLSAAVILGIVWGGWHLPQFLIAEWETPHRDVGDLFAFLAFTVAASIVLSWITNTARGSVLLAVLAHNAINWALSVWEKATGQKVTSLWPAVLGLAVLAVIAVAVTRGRLGYRNSQ